MRHDRSGGSDRFAGLGFDAMLAIALDQDFSAATARAALLLLSGPGATRRYFEELSLGANFQRTLVRVSLIADFVSVLRILSHFGVNTFRGQFGIRFLIDSLIGQIYGAFMRLNIICISFLR